MDVTSCNYKHSVSNFTTQTRVLSGALGLVWTPCRELLANFLSWTESESYVTTHSQSASLSWNKAPILDLRKDFNCSLTVAVVFIWVVLSDERTGLSLALAAGPRQRSQSLVRVPWDSLPYIYYCLRSKTSLFVASYVSQGHGGGGGGIQPRLHTRIFVNCRGLWTVNCPEADCSFSLAISKRTEQQSPPRTVHLIPRLSFDTVLGLPNCWPISCWLPMDYCVLFVAVVIS
jgi:hypothetical protein